MQKPKKENLKSTKKVLKPKTKIGSPSIKKDEFELEFKKEESVSEVLKRLEEHGVIFMEEPKERRASGRTTRQADAYVQELFTKGEIKVLDHAGSEGIANKSLFNVILGRLRNEHPTVRFEFNREKWSIKLIKNMKRTIQH